MYTPSSTYRIQFNNQFTFKMLAEHLQYLTSLGPGAVYASPVFGAVPGSNHGYDVVNTHVFNKEIGTDEEFEDISRYLKTKNTGWIQDIVPNHMAFHPANGWLMDVLEKGRQSAYAGYFDIDWDHPVFKNKVMVPVLGKTPEQAIIDDEIKLIWKNGGFFITYFDFHIPVSGESFHELLEENKVMEDSYYVGQGIENADYRNDPAFRGFGWSNSRERLQAIYETDNSFESFINHICEEINADKAKMSDLLSGQHFVLTYWQDVEKHLNYRRFFTINGLISLSMEKLQVFDDYHAFIHQKVQSGSFDGLRIDHIDGLKDPNMYFERLRAKMGEDTFIVVEKILEHHEELQKDWPLQGSSGYDFLALANNVFTNRNNIGRLHDFYHELTGNSLTADEVIYEKKKMILNQSFRGDWDNISRLISNSGLIAYDDRITFENMQDATGEFLVNCPVYKLYSGKLPPEPEDRTILEEIFEKAIKRTPDLSAPLKKLRDIFLDNYTENPEKKEAALEIFLKCMQYTGPLMAKGVEDTSMYTWAAFIAHNEVGDAIDAAGISTEDFHQMMIDRQTHYPKSINATATHDTKRGEDTRARLNVISDLASEWMQLVNGWMTGNKLQKKIINDRPAPDVNEEYFIYQALAGAFPMDSRPGPELQERIGNYLQKALREAKIHSNWNSPDEAYENAVTDFTGTLLGDEENFLGNFQPFLKKIIPHGIINSLSQLVLKCTCPGIPDFYQGTELWDLSLVDPDNRRPVDYHKRDKILNELKSFQKEQKEKFFTRLLQSKEDGKIKLWLTHILMNERRIHEFTSAGYKPLHVKGVFRDHVLAFARIIQNSWYITVVPLHTALLPVLKNNPDWRNTTVELPAEAPGEWKLLWDDSLFKSGRELPLSRVLPGGCPAVLKGEKIKTGRGSGVLLHITSLPGKYGTGDLGEEAFRFADLLHEAKQSYWQILPFNPAGASFSPYSSPSAFAGNTTLLAPDDLYRHGLLKMLPDSLPDSATADFASAENLRRAILKEALENFNGMNSPLLQKRFDDFCGREQSWLDDFALFNIFKNEFGGKSWNEWPEDIKKRDEDTLSGYREKFTPDITRIKFGQYLFSVQFKRFKEYVNTKGIRIIGDMPIYVSYDSSDVWANPGLFDLDEDLKMRNVAGVPPDYFSKTGQLWNMPVYNWQRMENDHYSWWKRRIRKNLEYCDMLRFDHFRGFSSFWKVPAGETTAVHGKWTPGPGSSFFSALKEEFTKMPFIAEDLGDIDAGVYKLRDEFNLPGMKVLQFAFGDNMPHSVHIPHLHTRNSVVYTGTHDNNTIRGWFRKEANRKNRNQIRQYLNRKIKQQGITEEFIRMAFGSVARLAIIPVQDLLDFDETSRLNDPSQAEGNWTWKLKMNDLKDKDFEKLKELTGLYGREP